MLTWAYGATLAPGLTWANNSSDSGDLATAAAVLGVAHPTGYPTYLLLARLLQALPVGSLAWRTNLLSALAAVLTALVVAVLVGTLLEGQRWRRLAALGAALAFGLSPGCWALAVVTEVYTLNVLFVALLFCFTLRNLQPAPLPAWVGVLQGLVAGLALGNHITVALPVAGWLLASGAAAFAGRRVSTLGPCLAGLGAGLLVYLYLPVRAATHPPVNWGAPDDWAGFWWVISGQPYRELAFGLPPEQMGGRLAAWASLLRDQFGLPGIVLGAGGLLYAQVDSPRRRFLWLTAVLAAGYSVFAIAYNSADSDAYLLPVYLIVALWAGVGLALVLAALERLPHLARLVLPGGLALLLALALAWRIPATARQVDARGDQRASGWAHLVLTDAPPGAVLLTSSDRDTFTLWYYHYALGWRPDTLVVVEPLLGFAWYRENLRARYPMLPLPDAEGADPAAEWLAALRRVGPLCRTDPQGAGPLVCEDR